MTAAALQTLVATEPPVATEVLLHRNTCARLVSQFWRAAVALVLCLAGIVAWKSVLEERFVAKRWGTVVPGAIYRSGQVSQFLIADRLQRHRIDVILDLGGNRPEDPHQAAERIAAAAQGIVRHAFRLKGDGTGDPRQYVAALTELAAARQRGQRVLVHCAAGSQRTGACIVFFRLLLERSSPQAAYAELVRFGWSPTQSQDRKLLHYVNTNLARVAAGLVDAGVLRDVPRNLPTFGPDLGPSPRRAREDSV